MACPELAAAVVASFIAGLDDFHLRRNACKRIAQLLRSAPLSDVNPAEAPASSPSPGKEILLAEIQERVLLGPDLVEPDVVEARLHELVDLR